MSAPLRNPNATHTSNPHRIARYGLMPRSTANFVITIEPSAMIIPQDRSIPAVRMTSVCPMATTPTTITCCRISEKFCPARKRSDWYAKNAQASASAMNGPKVATGGRCSSSPRTPGLAAAAVWVLTSCTPTLNKSHPRVRGWEGSGRRSAPARAQAKLGVFAVDALHGLVGDERDAGVGVARDFLARLRVCNARVDAELRHFQRVLLRSGPDESGLYVAPTFEPRSQRYDQHALRPAG